MVGRGGLLKLNARAFRTLDAPRNGIVEIAGPERAPFNEIVTRYLKAVGHPREVVRDPKARYWGAQVVYQHELPNVPGKSIKVRPPEVPSDFGWQSARLR